MKYLFYVIVGNVLNVLQILIMIRVALSWISFNPYNQIIKIIFQITDIILEPIRESIPYQMGGVDFSPMIAFILIGLMRNFLFSVI